MNVDKMYCKKCGIENDKDALFCKKCGANLIEEYGQKLEKEREKRKQEKKPKNRVKIKKVRKKGKRKPSKRKQKNQKTTERKMGWFAKLVMVFLILLVFALIGICCAMGYKLYSDENIEVPNVITMTYQEAESTLLDKSLNIERKEKIVEEEELAGTVLKQSIKPGKKVGKNTVVKVEVGVLTNFILVPNVVGMNIDKGKNMLKHLNISYSISYEEVLEGDDNIILSQSPKKGSKIKKEEKIELKVSKKIESDPNKKEDIDKDEIDMDNNEDETLE